MARNYSSVAVVATGLLLSLGGSSVAAHGDSEFSVHLVSPGEPQHLSAGPTIWSERPGEVPPVYSDPPPVSRRDVAGKMARAWVRPGERVSIAFGFSPAGSSVWVARAVRYDRAGSLVLRQRARASRSSPSGLVTFRMPSTAVIAQVTGRDSQGRGSVAGRIILQPRSATYCKRLLRAYRSSRGKRRNRIVVLLRTRCMHAGAIRKAKRRS